MCKGFCASMKPLIFRLTNTSPDASLLTLQLHPLGGSVSASRPVSQTVHRSVKQSVGRSGLLFCACIISGCRYAGRDSRRNIAVQVACAYAPGIQLCCCCCNSCRALQIPGRRFVAPASVKALLCGDLQLPAAPWFLLIAHHCADCTNIPQTGVCQLGF